MGGGKQNTHGSLVVVEHMWNPLCTNFCLPQYCACVQGQISLFSLWRSSAVADDVAAFREASSLSSRPCIMALTHRRTIAYDETRDPKTFHQPTVTI
jgi:hypothetical protein